MRQSQHVVLAPSSLYYQKVPHQKRETEQKWKDYKKVAPTGTLDSVLNSIDGEQKLWGGVGYVAAVLRKRLCFVADNVRGFVLNVEWLRKRNSLPTKHSDFWSNEAAHSDTMQAIPDWAASFRPISRLSSDVMLIPERLLHVGIMWLFY